MARDAFDHDLDVRQGFLTLIYHHVPGSGTWTLLNQGSVWTPNQAADTAQHGRIGDKTKLTVPGAIATDVSIEVYIEENMSELALLMDRSARPGGGWLGTEVIELDPTLKHDFKAVNFDGPTTSANIKFTEYVNGWTPTGNQVALDENTTARRAVIPGVAESYYIMPEAGT